MNEKPAHPQYCQVLFIHATAFNAPASDSQHGNTLQDWVDVYAGPFVLRVCSGNLFSKTQMKPKGVINKNNQTKTKRKVQQLKSLHCCMTLEM